MPAVSPISQRRPDYIKSLNPGLRARPAVQVLSRGRREDSKHKKKKTPRLTTGFKLTLMIDGTVFIPLLMLQIEVLEVLKEQTFTPKYL